MNRRLPTLRRRTRDIQTELEKLQAEFNLSNTLESLGIKGDLLTYFTFPTIHSGYSMVEEVCWYCKNESITTIDQREFYSRGCRFIETHGRVIVNFPTKAALKEFATLLKEIAYSGHMIDNLYGERAEKYFAKRRAAMDLVEQLLKKYIVKDKSKLKGTAQISIQFNR